MSEEEKTPVVVAIDAIETPTAQLLNSGIHSRDVAMALAGNLLSVCHETRIGAVRGSLEVLFECADIMGKEKAIDPVTLESAIEVVVSAISAMCHPDALTVEIAGTLLKRAGSLAAAKSILDTVERVIAERPGSN